jgi:hypothetical protein
MTIPTNPDKGTYNGVGGNRCTLANLNPRTDYNAWIKRYPAFEARI